jgi:hypothetical protein
MNGEMKNSGLGEALMVSDGVRFRAVRQVENKGLCRCVTVVMWQVAAAGSMTRAGQELADKNAGAMRSLLATCSSNSVWLKNGSSRAQKACRSGHWYTKDCGKQSSEARPSNNINSHQYLLRTSDAVHGCVAVEG